MNAFNHTRNKDTGTQQVIHDDYNLVEQQFGVRFDLLHTDMAS